MVRFWIAGGIPPVKELKEKSMMVKEEGKEVNGRLPEKLLFWRLRS